MAKQSKERLTLYEKIARVAESGIGDSVGLGKSSSDEELDSLDLRIKKLFNLIYKPSNRGNMMFFVMYDIRSNKVRTIISKYLINKGCYRIQKSIFIGNLNQNIYNQIRQDLSDVQSFYENKDSIMVLPISTDYLYAMKIIGQHVDLDLITGSKNTLFF